MAGKGIQDLEALVVDDDPTILRLVAAILTSIGIGKVESAGDGETAWAMIGEAPFDLIVCDWEMPGMSGIQLLGKLRESGLDTPFLMLTARATGDAVSEAAHLGVDAYIAKPFTPQDLQAKVRALASRLTG